MRASAIRVASLAVLVLAVVSPCVASDCPWGFAAVKIVKTGTGYGTVSAPPSPIAGPISCGSVCGSCYPLATPVPVTASVSAGSLFGSWEGGCTTSSNLACGVGPLKGDVTVTVSFFRPQLQTVRQSGYGTIVSQPAGINCGTDCTEFYNVGTSVKVTATPANGYDFMGWAGVTCSGTGDCTAIMDQSRVVYADFAPWPQFTIMKSGSGTVVSSPTGINCGTVCTAPFPRGTSVTLTSIPAPGATFLGWSSATDPIGSRTSFIGATTTYACTGSAMTCTFTMKGGANQPATFSALSYPLTVTRGGFGRVTSNPAGIDCGTICSASFKDGTPVVLSAVPDANWTFFGWTGACTGSAASCTVTMAAPASVAANFFTRATQ